MDNKLLLVKSLTLLYRESLVATKSENSSELVRNVIENIKLSDLNLTINKERDILQALKSTALEMCENGADYEYEKSDFLQRLKSNCLDDEALYDTLVQGIEPELVDASIKRSIVNIRKSIHNHFREQQVESLVSKAAVEFRHHRDNIKSVTAWVSSLLTQLEPFQTSAGGKDPAVIGDVEMHDEDKVREVFASIKEEENGSTIFRTGWQGVNRMLDGGFRRGEEWVFGGLQHSYKSGFSLTVFKQMAMYNKPIMSDPTKKPLLLRISFEDTLLINFKFLYKNIRENETGEVINSIDLSDEEVSKYVRDKLSVNGFYVKFMHVNPSLWTYRDICNKIIELEAEGYEVQVCMLDYLLKVPTTGCDQGSTGTDIRNMFERMKNFMASKNILFITPHQLSTEAKQLKRDGRQDFVKQLIGGGYYAGTKQLDQVVDGELFTDIEKLNREAFLVIQRGKHRKVNQTPEEHLYAVLKFVKGGCIPDDLGKADSTRLKVGGGVIGSGEETPYWEFKEQI